MLLLLRVFGVLAAVAAVAAQGIWSSVSTCDAAVPTQHWYRGNMSRIQVQSNNQCLDVQVGSDRVCVSGAAVGSHTHSLHTCVAGALCATLSVR
jgi:hypothetical protein